MLSGTNMPVFPITGLAAAGFIPDIRPDSLPPNAFTDSRDIRFARGGAEVAKGDVPIKTVPTVEPFYAIQCRRVDDSLEWVYCGLNKIYAIKNGIEYNITRQTAGVDVNYAAVTNKRWNGGLFNNVLVLNNSVDLPQSWTSLDTSVRVQDLANWPTTWRAAVIRPFKNYLLALDMTESSTRYPTRLRWSHPADPGTVPSSWDTTDVTKDAGEIPIGAGFGNLVDAVPLRDSMVLYKEDSCHLLTYIGGTFIFKITGLFQNFGIPSRDCAVEYVPGRHFVFTGSDLLVHDGQTSRSLLLDRARDWLSRLDLSQISFCFVVADTQNEEAWFCYPTSVEGTAGYGGLVQEAIVWNWRTDVLSYRSLRKTNYITTGLISPDDIDDLWDTDPTLQPWELETVPWDISRFLGYRHLFYCKSNPFLCVGDLGYGSDGQGIAPVLERSGLGFPLKVGQPPDVTCMKFCRAVWPRFTGPDGAILSIELGRQLEVDGLIEWSPAVDFIIGTDKKLNCALSGRTFAVRVQTKNALTAPSSWRLVSVDFDVSPAGSY